MESSQHIGKILLTVKEEKINELTWISS
jgi:hypothetical protein